MKVSELMDILKEADPDKDVFVMDNHAIYEAQSVEIAETGNIFLNFDNWYNKCIADWLTSPIKPLAKEAYGIKEEGNEERRDPNNSVSIQDEPAES